MPEHDDASIPGSFLLAISGAATGEDIEAEVARWLPGFSPPQRAIAEEFAAQQVELRRTAVEAGRLALVDPLTGAANRRGFDGYGDAHLGRWRHDSQPFALGILDIDNFKHVNDRFGHNAGDALLKLMVETLTAQSRSDDVIARIGGEEFAILIAHATKDEALSVFERIRRTVAGLSLPVGTDHVQVTASIGVATAGPDDTSVDDIFVRADAALYEAKAAGRDNVVFRGPESPEKRAEIATDGE